MNTSEVLFDTRGRCNPSKSSRVFERMSIFNENLSNDYYYKINFKQPDFRKIFSRYIDIGIAATNLPSIEKFQSNAEFLLKEIESSIKLNGVLNGPHIPFIIPSYQVKRDIGDDIESNILPMLSKSFHKYDSKAHFKSVFQGHSHLNEKIQFVENSGQDRLLANLSKQPVVGWFFPQAFQEYDYASQIERFKELSLPKNICLSGVHDIAASLIGSPNLLISEEFYSPILCSSGLKHEDERLVLMFKSYGPHLEFWCLSQMLTPAKTQVSEQWTGGLTIFKSV